MGRVTSAILEAPELTEEQKQVQEKLANEILDELDELSLEAGR